MALSEQMRHDIIQVHFKIKYIEEQVGISHYELAVYCYNYSIGTHSIKHHLLDMR